MPRRKQPTHLYSVFVTYYASAEIKARVEARQAVLQPSQVIPEEWYSGTSQSRAAYSFFRAAQAAMKNPLAASLIVWQDREVIIRLTVEHSGL
jgi:hypothetical protein